MFLSLVHIHMETCFPRGGAPHTLKKPQIQDKNNESYSPQLIHHTDQHKERVLADSLLEGVRTVAESSVCALWSRTMKATVYVDYKIQYNTFNQKFTSSCTFMTLRQVMRQALLF